MRAEGAFNELCAPLWQKMRAQRVFANSTRRADKDDIQLSASQRLGVVPQRYLMSEENQKYMLALSGTDNFKHVDVGDFVISLRSFEGGFEYSTFSGCVSPAYTVLKPKIDIDASYWRYFFKSDVFKQILSAFNVGIRDGKSIRYEDFCKIVLPIPDNTTQHIISTYLDRETNRIDALVNAKTHFIDLLREKRQALITHAVTKGLDPNVKMKHSGVEWLGQVPEHWTIKRLKYLLEPNGLVRGPFGGDLKKEIFVDQGIKVYEQKNAIYQSYKLGDSYITEDKFSDMSRFQVHADDYIMSCSGTIGKTYRIPAEAPTGIINQALLVIRFKADIINDFADWLFVADFFTTQIIDNSQGGAMKNLVGIDVFKSIFLQLPPIEEQRRIATFLNLKTARIDALITKTERSIELLKERRSALITAAVTGQIDLREVE